MYPMIVKAYRIVVVSAWMLLGALIVACSDSNSVAEQHSAAGQSERLNSVLIFSKSPGWRHDSIPAGVEALTKLVEQRGLTPVATEDASVFTDRKSTRLNSSHVAISYAVFC